MISLPEKTTVRRLDIAGDGMIWYVQLGGLWPARPLGPEERSVQRVAVAQRSQVAPVRDRSHRRQSFGTTSRRSGRTHSCASTRRPRNFKAGRSPRATSMLVSIGIYAPDPRTAIFVIPPNRHQIRCIAGRSGSPARRVSGKARRQAERLTRRRVCKGIATDAENAIECCFMSIDAWSAQ